MTIAFVQEQEGTSNGAATSIPSVAMATTTGNDLIVCARHEDGPLPDATTCTFTDTAGNTYVNLGAVSLSSGSETERIYAAYCLGATGNAANVITATFSASRSFRRVIVTEFSHSSALTMSSSNTGGSATQTTAPALGSLTALTGDLVIGVFGNYDSGPSFTAGTGYTNSHSNQTFLVHLIYQIVPSGGSYTPNAVYTIADTFVALGAVFTEASGVTAASLPPQNLLARIHPLLQM